MDDPTAHWSDAEPADRPRRRWRLLLAAAAVPWLALVVVTWRGGAAPEPAVVTATATPAPDDRSATASEASPPGGADAPDALVPTDPVGDGPPDPGPDGPYHHGPDDDPGGGPGDRPAGEHTVGPQATVTDGDAATVAAAVARAWLSDDGAPDLAGPQVEAQRDGYLEHLTVRRIEVVTPTAVIVTVGVLLLEREGERYTRVRAADVLVPLTLSADAVHPAGTPWWSPHEVDLTPRPPELEPADDPDLHDLVVATLQDAGYRDVEVDRVGQGSDGLVVAETRATTDQGDQVDAPLWLQAHPDGDLELLGPRPRAP